MEVSEDLVTSDFAEFYEREYASVYRAAYALAGQREVALDATQEAFKRAFVRWRRLAREGWAAGWVMTTALNLCRKEARRAAGSGGETVPPVVEPASADRLDLIAALRSLPTRQAEAALLFYWGDLPVPVVATLMHVAEGTVKAHLFHARQSLRAALDAPLDDEIHPMTGRLEGR
ncbi:MAG: sigma-70 family RNA polymerase sigma factor [Actinomycetota bacterium]|nr:sigma-70 family RNA polymerase sigma factor [Actinomycetota bacterium]